MKNNITNITHSHSLAHPKYRADIDGLRAIAVLAVVVFHAFPTWLKGGFVGVDVFFVISGFLITGIIVENLENNTFSFREFYARRIRRIFPALILVMAACYAFGWHVLFADEYKQLGKHVAAGAGFVSNLVFWQESGYFDTVSAVKPLLHLWSLGVEEQFYIVWPLLLFLAWKRKFSFLLTCLIISVASFSCNVYEIHHDASGAFYSPVTRFWELMLGGIMAYVSSHKLVFEKHLNQLVNVGQTKLIGPIFHNGAMRHNIQSIAGILLIGISILIVEKKSSFPGWWALLPTLGACLVIASGPKAWLNQKILSNRLLVWFGLISYPLYLWHWPMLSFARILASETPSRGIRIAVVLLSIILAWLTYKLIENPFRRGKNNKAKVYILSALMICVGFVGYITDERDGLNFRLKKFEVSVNNIKLVIESTSACRAEIPLNSRYCMLAKPGVTPTVALIGDSHSNRLFAPLSKRYQAMGENLVQLGGGGCLPFWDIETGSIGNPNKCDEQMLPILNYVLNTKSIKTVLMLNRGPLYIEGNDLYRKDNYFIKDTQHPQHTDAKEIYAEALENTIKRLASAKKKIIIMIDEPEFDYNPLSCIDLKRPLGQYFKNMPSCMIDRQDVSRRNHNYIAITKSVARQFDNVKIVNLQDALCDNKYCYGIKNGNLLYQDPDHLNPFGAEYVVNQLWREF